MGSLPYPRYAVILHLRHPLIVAIGRCQRVCRSHLADGLAQSCCTGPSISQASVETIHRHIQVALGQGAAMRLDDCLPG